MPMEAKEVERIGRDISKAVAEGNSSPMITTLLDKLHAGVQPSEELLRSTKIGMVVNRLKQHKDPAVAKLADEVVSKWRREVRKKSSNSPAPAAPAAQPASAPKSKTKLSVPPEKRNTKADNVDIKVTGNAIRDSCVKLMYDGIAFMSEEAPDEILRVAIQVEGAAFKKYQPETSEPYKTKMRSLYMNLKNKSSNKLRIRVFTGDIPPERFVVMTHDELKSEERRAEEAKFSKENMDKAMVAQVEKSVSAELTCGKCQQKKVSYSQAQTRSADEPMTTFCECLNCGNRWKFS
ncbi:transcription elongation factor S-II [Trichodelitschia bisporula]|uniref:Transcription elongation factor n=1 Tax=Trichodelitschia bisporula TaxID=703511 RepID=A0A6G1I6Q9_9PEZI|nr:transcription elongation factor S-II [Trichodelitschia bisporula]